MGLVLFLKLYFLIIVYQLKKLWFLAHWFYCHKSLGVVDIQNYIDLIIM